MTGVNLLTPTHGLTIYSIPVSSSGILHRGTITIICNLLTLQVCMAFCWGFYRVGMTRDCAFFLLYFRCDIIDVAVEMDRILRPGGWLLVQDTIEIIDKLSPVLHSLHWSTTLYQGQFLVGKKDFWRPTWWWPIQSWTNIKIIFFLLVLLQKKKREKKEKERER